MRRPRTLLCTALIMATLSWGGVQVSAARADAVAGFDVSTIPPVQTGGGQAQPVQALAVSAGELLRWNTDVERTPLAGPAGDEPSGSTAPVVAAPAPQIATQPLLVSGPWTVVPTTGYDGYSRVDMFTVYANGAPAFSSPDNLTGDLVDLYGDVLVYTTYSQESSSTPVVEHIRNLATGLETAAPFNGIGGGGLLSERSYPMNGDLGVIQAPETPGAEFSGVDVPASVCPQPASGLIAAYRNWVEVTCAGQPTVIDTLAMRAYPMNLPGARLGDGVLLQTSNTCVNVEVLLTMTTPTCLPSSPQSPGAVFDDTGGGLIAWAETDETAHVARILGAVPQIGSTTAPSVVAGGSPWTVSLPVSEPTSWTLSLRPAGEPEAQPFAKITGSSGAGAVTATWDGVQGAATANLADGVDWSLVATTAGDREVGVTGLFHLSTAITMPVTPTPAPSTVTPSQAAPAPHAPHIVSTLGRVTTVRGVVQLKQGHRVTLTSSSAGSAGCVRVVLLKQVGKTWRQVSATRCLSATKRAATAEAVKTAGVYRLELVWSGASKPLKLYAIKVT